MSVYHRKAMLQLQPAINHNAMTTMHVHWGSSHDSLLGFILWMYNIPTYSLSKYLFPTRVMVHDIRKALFTQFLKSSQSIVIHKVMCANQYQYQVKLKKTEMIGRVACQYDIAEMLQDDLLYATNYTLNSLTPSQLKFYYHVIQQQWKHGRQCSQQLQSMSNKINSSIHQTKYAHFHQLHKVFIPFTPLDC